MDFFDDGEDRGEWVDGFFRGERRGGGGDQRDGDVTKHISEA